MLFDSKGNALSFPPIINSNDLGKVTEETRNLLVEVTGTMHKTVLNTLNLVTSALIDRGGKAYAATIHYPQDSEYPDKEVVTPDFSGRCVSLSVEYTNKLLGLKLSAHRISELLLTAGLGIEKTQADSVEVLVPCYRVDVMHQVDLIEDVAIAYGYNNIEPLWRELATTGRAKPDQRFNRYRTGTYGWFRLPRNLNLHVDQSGKPLRKNEHAKNPQRGTCQPKSRHHDVPAQLAAAKPHGVSQQ